MSSTEQVGRSDTGFWVESTATRKERRQARKHVTQLVQGTDRGDEQEHIEVDLPKPRYRNGGKRKKNFRGKTHLKRRPHRASTKVFAATYPFVAQAGLGPKGMYMGEEKTGGGSFTVDPWKWYELGFVTSMAIVLMGIPGVGKSTCAKTMVSRLVHAGKKAAVCSDLKGEWVRVAHYLGGKAIGVGPGRGNRINPLDAGLRPSKTSDGRQMSDAEWSGMVRTRRSTLLKTLVDILRDGEKWAGEEHTALSRALDLATKNHPVPTLPHIITYLSDPELSPSVAVQKAGESLSHHLARCIDGDVAGLFDGESTVEFDADAPMMVIDTSALQGASKEARRITNACTGAWVEAAVTNPDGGQRILIYEEGWDSMTDPAQLARMVEQWKLAREYGIVNLLIIHKLADMDMAGDMGSKVRSMARSLLADTEIRIVYRQSSDSLKATKEDLGLTDEEIAKVKKLKQGQALWKVGAKPYIVDNVMTEAEEPVFRTDSRIVEAAA